jgi:flagellar FliJ protein
MKRFRFTLDAVLEIKRRREEALQRELSVLMARKSEGQRRLASLLAGKESLVGSQKSRRLSGTVKSGEESWFQAAFQAQDGQIQAQVSVLADLEVKGKMKRSELVEASREKKVYEKLEENQWKEYLMEANREEQAFLDELSQNQFTAKVSAA